MIDFDKILASALSDGDSIEDIATKFTEALNGISKAKVAKEKEQSARDFLIEHTHKTFDEHYQEQKLDLADASALVWLCAVNGTDEGKAMTSREDLNAFFDFVRDDIRTIMDKWKGYKTVTSILGLNHKKCDCGKCANKSKEDKKAETGRKPQSDREIVESFLRDLFS